jgi:hypothetical protein
VVVAAACDDCADMALSKQNSSSSPRIRARSAGARRPPFSPAERIAIQIAAVVTIGFCAYGFATSSPSTFGYVLSVVVIGAAIIWLRRSVVPSWLAFGIVIAAVLHLGGGLVNVGHNVLYNASIGPFSKALGTHYFQYDHLAHAYVSFIVAFTCWTLLAAPQEATHHRRDLVILAVGTALGLGALNEVVEFLATLAHHGAHVGGYFNTGWDLICNLIGAAGAGFAIARSDPRARPDPAELPA